MKKLFVIAAMAAIATSASAQKSEITKSRAAFDQSTKTETYKDENGKEAQRTVIVWEKVEEAKSLLADAKAAWDAAKADPKKAAKIKPEVIAMGYDLKGDIYQRIMAGELNHAVAKEPLDTMKFYNSLTECLDAYEECFKVDEKGQYTAKNLSNFMKFRAYYMYCGQFFSTNGQNKMAAETFEKWLNFPKRYTITGGDADLGNGGDNPFDPNMVAYYAALSLYQAKDYAGMSRFEEQAMAYEKEQENVRQLYMVSAMEQGDTARWESMAHKFALEGTVGEGVVQNLMARYFSTNQTDKVMAFAKELEEALPGNKIAPYAQGIVYMNASQFDEAIAAFTKAVDIDPDYSDALFNIGVCLFNQGIAVNSANLEKKFKTQADADAADENAREYFRKAEPYLLRVQELLPDQPERWAHRLASVYSILNNKEKQKEYEALAGE